MEINKDLIKKDLISKSNKILEKNNEPFLVEDISIMNSKDIVNFLGSLRVMVEDSVKKIISELNESFKEYENVSIRHNKVTPCCEAPYFHISFTVKVYR